MAHRHPLKILKTRTNIYHYNPKNGAGLGITYYKIHYSKIECFTDLLNLNLGIKERYLKRKLCLSKILMLSGNIKYNPTLVYQSIIDNLKCLLKYPIDYINLIKRIVFVKFSETVLKMTFDYRF